MRRVDRAWRIGLAASAMLLIGGQVRNSTTHGILQLRLNGRGYAWRFVPVAGRSFTDAGKGTCH